MKKLVFATNNKHKLEEVRSILHGHIEVLSLEDIGCYDDIPETADTLEGNALLKARHIWRQYALPCFADDTGLEVDALDGAPGVYSARYAGEDCNAENNMQKLLTELRDIPSPRTARFRTVIAFIDEEGERVVEGSIEGDILLEREGVGGFGYDPIFLPEGYNSSFASLGSELKNSMSHRTRAVQKLVDLLLPSKS